VSKNNTDTIPIPIQYKICTLGSLSVINQLNNIDVPKTSAVLRNVCDKLQILQSSPITERSW